MQLYMGSWGAYGWHYLPWIAKRSGVSPSPSSSSSSSSSPSPSPSSSTPATRTLCRLVHAEYLCVGILAFQTWDFVASCTMPEHYVTEFLVHHVLSAITAYMALEYRMVHHYAIFFGGCSEISSIFLVWVNMDQYFPASNIGSSVWTTFIMMNQGIFVIAFIAYRIVGWIAVSIPLWKDVMSVLPQPAKHYRPGKVWFLRVFLFMDVALGALQVYWFMTGLLPKVIEVVATATREQPQMTS